MNKKSNPNKLIDLAYVTETVYGDENFLIEFCQAAVLSFSEFKNSFRKHLLERNEAEFRKSGHKIKPVAQMLKIDVLLDEYEHSKNLIQNNRPDEEIAEAANKMDSICNEVLNELQQILNNKKA